jgi:hypothetical protein
MSKPARPNRSDKPLLDHTKSFSNALKIFPTPKMSAFRVVLRTGGRIHQGIDPFWVLFRSCDGSGDDTLFTCPGRNGIAQACPAAASDGRQNGSERCQIDLREHCLDRENTACRH